jgi:general secretion pathway protein D
MPTNRVRSSDSFASTSWRFAAVTIALAVSLSGPQNTALGPAAARAQAAEPAAATAPAASLSSYQTIVYYLENADASKLVTVLNSVYGAGAGGARTLEVPNQAVSIVADIGTNSLVISAPTPNMPAVLDTIKKLDIAPYQVLIEVVILEVTLDKSNSLGVDWTYDRSNVDFNIRSNVTPQQPVELITMTGLKQAIIGSHRNFHAVIAALATDNKTRILATPRLFASNNREASILIGDQVPVLTSTAVSGGAVLQTAFSYQDVGIKLLVTPHINRRRQTVMDLTQEIKTIRTLPTPLGVTAANPIFTTRQSKTSVSLDDGQAAVIGGLIRTDRTRIESKVPLLGDIPLIGAAFRSKADQEVKTEILIFISTRVVTSDSEMQGLVHEQMQNSNLPQAHAATLFSDTHSIGTGVRFIGNYVVK